MIEFGGECMNCPKCGTPMEVDFELVDPKVIVYKCPNCGEKVSDY